MAALRLRLSLLGPPLAELDGAPIAVDTRKAIALLAYLAVTGRPQSRDSLANLLWPDYDTEHARAALRRTLSTLRSALAGGWVEAERDTVSLGRVGVWADVDEFRRLLVECRDHGHPESEICPACLRALGEAARLYRGDFLAGFGLRDSFNFDDWQLFEADGFRRELASALDRLAEGHAARGEYAQAIEHARRRLTLDALHEPAHRLLMQLYAWSGERAAALRQYRDCVRVLDQELGVPPLEETTALYQAVKEGSARAPAPARPRAEAAAGPHSHPMVGRAVEWKALLESHAGVGTDGRLVVLEGEAGIGKTRLAEEFVAHVRSLGGVAVAARCFEGEASLAYGAVIELLRGVLRELDADGVEPAALAEASRLLPELGPAPPPLEGPGAEARFLDGVAGVLLAASGLRPPGVLFVDDVHWADEASLGALAYLVRRLQGRPVLIVVTWRAEETPAGHPARRLLTETLRTGQARVISPARLGLADVADLVQAAGLGPELGTRLHAETGGLPFFVVEYLDALEGEEPDWALPATVRDLLRSRLVSVSEVGAQVLAAAAVLGRSFDVETVREASGRGEEETVSALEELTRRGIVAEGEGGAYDFRHDQARALAYEETSLARRRLLHRRVADALAARSRGGAQASIVALHYRLAGQDAAAAEWFRAAGEHARSLYANAEALAHFHAALALGHADTAALHRAIGDLETLAGDYAGALRSYEIAAAQSGSEGLAAIEHRIGLVHHRRGEWELAESAFQGALAALGEGEDGRRARIAADRSLTAHQRGRRKEALALAERARDTSASAQAHNILGILASKPAEARRHLEQSLALAESSHDSGARVAALNNLALAHRAEGELDRALALTGDALALCAEQGDRHREAALRNNAADLLHAAGRSEEAMAHLKEAVAIFAEVGEEGVMQPEIWKLVEW